MGKYKIGGKVGGGELNETDSGLIHAADSNANLPRGNFVSYYGAPGDPEGTSRVKSDGRYGREPGLSKKFTGNRQRQK